MIITVVTIDYINRKNEKDKMLTTYIDKEEVTKEFVMNNLPDINKNDIKILLDIDIENTELIL